MNASFPAMILSLEFGLARSSGLLINYENQSRWYLVLTILNISNTANFVLVIGHFMVGNLGNLDYFTNSFGAFSNVIVNLLKTCMFLAANQKLKLMMDKLERLAVDKNRSSYDTSLIADQKSKDYTRKYLLVVYLAVFGISLSPLLAMVEEYVKTGQVVQTRWNLPFKSK